MAKGIVSWVNPPENKGKIKRTDDSSNSIYEYNINAGDTVDGYVPKLDEIVVFTPGPGMTATGVETASITCKLVAEPTTIILSQSVVLSWTSENADMLTLNNGIGNVIPVASGSISHKPIEAGTIKYVLTATNTSGQSALSETLVNVVNE